MKAQAFINQGTAWMLLGGFSIVWVILGYVWSRNIKSTDDYLFAGRNVGLALSTATLLASWVTGNTTLAAPEMTYTLGFWGMIGYSLAGFGLVFFAPIALRIRKLSPQGNTSGEFIRTRYDKKTWIMFMIISTAYTIGWLITQGMGAGLLLQALAGIDYRVGMVVIITICTIYTLLGGMKAVIGTDFIQSLLIMGTLVIVAFIGINKFGYNNIYTGVMANAPEKFNILLPAGLMYAWNTGIFSMGEIFHSNLWWSRTYATREDIISKSFVISGLSFATVPLVTGVIALIAIAQNFEIPQVNMIFPIVAGKLLGKAGAILVFIIVFSSLASTIDSLLAATANLIVVDIYKNIINPKADDRKMQQAGKYIIIGLGVLTIILSWNYVTSMYGLLMFTGAMVASTIWPIIGGVYWEYANKDGAFAAMLIGSIVGLASYFIIAPYSAALIGAVVSAIVMVVWTKVKPQKFDWNKLRTQERLREV